MFDFYVRLFCYSADGSRKDNLDRLPDGEHIGHIPYIRFWTHEENHPPRC